MKVCRNEELAKDYWDTKAPKNIKEITANFAAGVQRYIDDHPEKASKYALKIEPWYVLTVGRAMILRWPLGTIVDDLKHGREKERKGSSLPDAFQRMVRRPVAIGRRRLDPAVGSAPHLGGARRHVRGSRARRRPAHERLFPGRFSHLGIGHNQHVGWALTTGGPDTSDVYKMNFKMGLPPKYEYDGKWRNAKMQFITVEIKDAARVRPSGPLYAPGTATFEPDKKTGEAYVALLPISMRWDCRTSSFRWRWPMTCTTFTRRSA